MSPRAVRRTRSRRASKHRLWPDRRAVSPVVGSLLMYAILVTSAVTVRVGIVPNLDENREAEEMAVVAERFAALKSDADRQLGPGTHGALSTLVPMRADAPAGILTNGQAATSLRFAPGTRDVSLAASELRVQSENGTTVFGGQETWTNITGSDEIAGIVDIHHLRVRVQDPGAEATGDHITLALLDRTGAFAGDLTVYLDHHPSGYSVNVQVRNAAGAVLYDQGSSYFKQDQPAFYWVDALADPVQFADVIGRTAAPFSLQVGESGLSGAFTLVYAEATGGGPTLVGSGGHLYQDWTQVSSGGMLAYEAQNLRFISQEFLFENGGVIVEQPVGDAFLAEPTMEVGRSDERTTLRLALPALTGRAGEWSGPQGISVEVRGTERTWLVATAPDFSMNVTTQHPHVWTAFWSNRFAAAGLEADAFQVTSGEGWARFDVYGDQSDPASRVHDVAIVLHQGSVVLTPGG